MSGPRDDGKFAGRKEYHPNRWVSRPPYGINMSIMDVGLGAGSPFVRHTAYVNDDSTAPTPSTYDQVVRLGEEVSNNPRVAGPMRLLGHHGEHGFARRAYEGSRPLYVSADTIGEGGRFRAPTVHDPMMGITYSIHTPSWTARGARRMAKKAFRERSHTQMWFNSDLHKSDDPLWWS